MKLKRIVFIIICVLLLPFMVNAKEYCKVVSGNGKDIGSEIACGSEHFYIVDSNQEDVKMLAKYNLNVGISVHKEAIKRESGDTRTDEEYCNALAIEKGGQAGASVAEGYCFYFTYADFSNVKQREDAKSAYVDENEEYLFPQIGNVYPSLAFASINNQMENTMDFKIPILPYNSPSVLLQYLKSEKYNNFFGDLEPNLREKVDISQVHLNEPSKYANELGASLYYYKNSFSDYNIKDLSLLTLEDLNNIATKRGKPLSYQSLYDNGRQVVSPDSPITKFGKLKDHVNKEDAWLYDRSYWLRTAYTQGDEFGGIYINGKYYYNFGLLFVDNLGEICGGASSATMIPGCQAIIRVVVGSGIRPTITIPTNELQFLIKTEVSNGGSISVVDNSLGGETITFDVSTNKGFRLKGLVLRTDSGEEVEFSEEDLTYNDDGTVTISKNKFIMPFENVTIEAKWELESLLVNPKTGRRIFIILGFLLAVVFAVKNVILKKKENV